MGFTKDLLAVAETVTDYIATHKLTEQEKHVLAEYRKETVCAHSKIGEYKCYVPIRFSAQSGHDEIDVDTCLQDEIYTLIRGRGITTIGCCCGHGRKQGYIQVVESDVEDMLMLGYEMIPQDGTGNGKYCFKPKTYLLCADGERKDGEYEETV